MVQGEFGSEATSVIATHVDAGLIYGQFRLKASSVLFTVAVPLEADGEPRLQQAFPSSIGVSPAEYLAIADAYARESGEATMAGALRLSEVAGSHPLTVGLQSFASSRCFLVTPDPTCRLNLPKPRDRIYVVYYDPSAREARLLGRYARSAPNVDESVLIKDVIGSEFPGGVRNLVVSQVSDLVEYADVEEEPGYTATLAYPFYAWGYRIAFQVPGSTVAVERTVTEARFLLPEYRHVPVFPSQLGVTVQQLVVILEAYREGSGRSVVAEIEEMKDDQANAGGTGLTAERLFVLFPSEEPEAVQRTGYVVTLGANGTAAYVGPSSR